MYLSEQKAREAAQQKTIDAPKQGKSSGWSRLDYTVKSYCFGLLWKVVPR
jgi:hypothetical protein